MIISLAKLSVLVTLCASASCVPFVVRQNIATPEEIARLAPDLGALPNTNPNPAGDCDGPPQLNGNIQKVPCSCPPLRDHYIAAMTANIQAGRVVNNTAVRISFPTGDSVQDKQDRITAAFITLQNLEGPGKGCPGVATTLGIQSRNLDTCGDFFCDDSPAPSAADPPPAETTSDVVTTTSAPPIAQPAPTQAPVDVVDGASTVTVTQFTVVTSVVTVTRGQEEVAQTSEAATPVTTTTPSAAAETSLAAGNGNISRDLVDRLAPDLGSQPNNQPNEFGDCSGPVQPDGSVKRVPCACPPTRPDFIDALLANIEAGRAVNNPSVRVTFPIGGSKEDQHARITAASITLQNLDGPGQGCPNASTTFAAQSNTIDGL